MGCDIHAFVEYRETDRWWSVAYDDMGLPRDYRMFGLLAGVRSMEPGLVEPRGLPDDASGSARDHLTDCDIHTRSWLTLAEYRVAVLRRSLMGAMHPLYGAVEAMMQRMEDGGMPTRIVFGFDN